MNRPRRLLAIVDKRSDVLDKVTYFFAVAVGGGLIIFLRSVGFPAVYVALVPLGFIVGYAFVALLLSRFRLREDRIADNCYYLGFIYTLISLAYALYGFQSGGLITEKLIQDFGVALSSTIVGVIVRLLLNQLRIDPIEVEHSARMTLAAASENLKTEMLQATRNFETFRMAIHQSFEESQKKLMDTVRETLEASVTDFSNTTRELLDESAKTFRRHAKSAERIESSAENMADKLEGLIARLEAVDIQPDILTSRLTPAIAEIERATTALRSRSEAEAAKIETVGRAIDRMHASAEAVEGQVTAQSQQINAIISLHSKIAESMEGLTKDIGSLSAFASQLESSLVDVQKSGNAGKIVFEEIELDAQNVLASLKQHNAGIAEQLQESRDMSGKLQEVLVDMAGSMERRLNEQRVREQVSTPGYPEGTAAQDPAAQ